MIVVGCTCARTAAGLPLIDGGACLMIDGVCVSAVAEERVTRRKHAAGCEAAIGALLSAAALDMGDVDLWVVSSCLEFQLTPGAPAWVSAEHTLSDLGVAPERVVVCDHHRSHALFTSLASPFERALVIVADGAGNALAPTEVGEAWFGTIDPEGHQCPGWRGPRYWDAPLARQSQYLAEGASLRLVGVDPPDPPRAGAGDVYWAFTRLLGFGSYSQAGKTMGLAAYGRPLSLPPPIVFDPANGAISGAFALDGLEADAPLVDWLASFGCRIQKRRPDEPILPVHEDLAWLVQEALEAALVAKVAYWTDRLGVGCVCLGGGVALNSVANGRVADVLGIEVHVPHAPGDSGQCVGNALHGALLLGDAIDRGSLRRPYLGPPRPPFDGRTVLPRMRAVQLDENDLVRDAAFRLSRGEVIGWFQGRSELGPRALGARSILAAPFRAEMRDRINAHIKRRELFRPLAPSLLAEASSAVVGRAPPSPFMSYTAPVRMAGLHGVTHVDGSARYHTVTADAAPRFHALLAAFRERTGVPVLLNTSLNQDCEPIVETPEDALALFQRTPLDVMYVDDWCVLRALA